MKPTPNPLVHDVDAVILQQLADGERPVAIAAALGYTRRAIDGRVRRIRDRLQARTTIHAVAIGIRERYID